MFLHHIRFALRTLWRQRFHTVVDIVGLGFGMAACLLILLLIRDQKNIDRFHEDPESIHLVTMPQQRAGGLLYEGSLSAAYGPTISDGLPAVEAVTRLIPTRTEFMHGDMRFELDGLYAEPSFFDIFGFKMVSGSRDGLLDRPGTVVLSDRTSRRLFGNVDPVGETLSTGDGTHLITGVVRTDDVRSHLVFDALFSFGTYQSGAVESARQVLNTATYVRLAPGTTADMVEAVLPRLSENVAGPRIPEFRLIPVTDFALGPAVRSSVSSGSVPWPAVAILGLLALSILLAAVLNYTALATARCMARAKEYGVRKIVGAGRRHIIQQLVLDGIITTLLALIVGRWLLGILVSGFNRLSLAQQLHVHIDPATLSDPYLLGIFVLFSMAVGAVGGLVPALRLSRLPPASVLRGGLSGESGRGRFRARRILTVGQMTFALVLMVSTVAAFRQADFMLAYDYGFRTDDILYVDLKGNSPESVLSRLDEHSAVVQAAAVRSVPGIGGHDMTHLVVDGDSTDVAEFTVQAGFAELLGIRLLAGSDFSSSSSGDILINATAARRLGFQSPELAVGQHIRVDSMDQPQKVVGVVEDIQFDRLDQEIGPMVLTRKPDAYRSVIVRTGAGAMPAVRRYIESFWGQVDPIHPPAVRSYESILDDSGFVKRLQDFVRLVGLMAVLSLVITCLGLMSMAAFRARARRKEVGIRKALGAGVRSVVWLLSREMLALMLVAVVVATPVAWIANRLWLQSFAHRIEFGPELILASSAIVLTATLTAVVSQTFRAAILNPVDVIREE